MRDSTVLSMSMESHPQTPDGKRTLNTAENIRITQERKRIKSRLGTVSRRAHTLEHELNFPFIGLFTFQSRCRTSFNNLQSNHKSTLYPHRTRVNIINMQPFSFRLLSYTAMSPQRHRSSFIVVCVFFKIKFAYTERLKS